MSVVKQPPNVVVASSSPNGWGVGVRLSDDGAEVYITKIANPKEKIEPIELVFSIQDWERYLKHQGSPVVVTKSDSGGSLIFHSQGYCLPGHQRLHFTAGEIQAFQNGIARGEFSLVALKELASN